MGDNRYEYHQFVFATYEDKVAKKESKGFIRMSLFAIVLVSLVLFF